MRKFVLFNGPPVAGCVRVHRGRLENGGGDTVHERPVNDVSMASNPSNVGHTGKAVTFVHVEDVFHGEGGTEEVASGGVDDTFGLACTAL